jgi:threonine dehydrogenase-like Zn-dependent dehydrogenase
MLEPMRRPWVLLVSCALAGLVLGRLMSSLPAPASETTFWIGNLSSPWAALAFLAGWSQRSRGWAATTGVAAEVACVAGFYSQFLVGDLVDPRRLGFVDATDALTLIGTAVSQWLWFVALYGASGSLGTAGVQLARHMGAHVTAVCGTRHVELVRSLGADEVVDYRTDDFTKNGLTYDAIIDAVGKYSFRRGRRALKPGGIYVATDGLPNLFWAVWTWRIGDKRLKFAGGRKSKEDVVFMKGLIEAGEYRAVIDRRYPMEQVVEAHRYVEAWHKAGNVVLTISGDRETVL